MPIAYLSHPIGEGDGEAMVQRADNIANSAAWISFFTKRTRWAIVAPWFVFVSTMPSNEHAPRRLVDMRTVLERSDFLVMVGGYISPHMTLEHKWAARAGIPVVDLTNLGVSPPDEEDDATIEVIMSKVRKMTTAKPRAIWLPLITMSDVRALVTARHALDVHLPNEHGAAVQVLDRIISAANDALD